ncbi:hypothetical protein FALCPG4_000749 [Fusarium falciforme]
MPISLPNPTQRGAHADRGRGGAGAIAPKTPDHTNSCLSTIHNHELNDPSPAVGPRPRTVPALRLSANPGEVCGSKRLQLCMPCHAMPCPTTTRHAMPCLALRALPASQPCECPQRCSRSRIPMPHAMHYDPDSSPPGSQTPPAR